MEDPLKWLISKVIGIFFKKLKIRPDFSLKSVKTLDVKRANNNGLDISKVENFLSIKLPNTTNTAECIVNDYMKIKKII